VSRTSGVRPLMSTSGHLARRRTSITRPLLAGVTTTTSGRDATGQTKGRCRRGVGRLTMTLTGGPRLTVGTTAARRRAGTSTTTMPPALTAAHRRRTRLATAMTAAWPLRARRTATTAHLMAASARTARHTPLVSARTGRRTRRAGVRTGRRTRRASATPGLPTLVTATLDRPTPATATRGLRTLVTVRLARPTAGTATRVLPTSVTGTPGRLTFAAAMSGGRPPSVRAATVHRSRPLNRRRSEGLSLTRSRCARSGSAGGRQPRSWKRSRGPST
jgi:hypothetical protein